VLRENDIVARRKDVETREVPQGAILVDMETGRCFRLNRVGAEVWSILEAPVAAAEICERIAVRYQKPVEQINLEVRALIDHLLREKLLEPAPPTSAQAS
jgi:hypothetical protein